MEAAESPSDKGLIGISPQKWQLGDSRGAPIGWVAS